MNQERLLQVLIGPRISEKSTIVAEKHRHITFKVVLDANKNEIHQAVEKLFEVEVESVRVLRVKGKSRRFKQILGQRSDWKKAYVTLKEGHDIKFTGSESGL